MARKKSQTLFPELKKNPVPTDELEKKYREMGFLRVAGLDEAGRGPLAGPVVAAAVILPERIDPKSPLRKLRDSKLLSSESREALYDVIVEHAEAFAWAMCDPEEIDSMNILAASLEAMRRAARKIEPPPGICLVDGKNQVPGAIPSVAVIKGDRKCMSIAAASIIAKVTRDRIMLEMDQKYPAYGFALHKGYATPEHKQALLAVGPCPIHRRTFQGVREYIKIEDRPKIKQLF
jgi:ribonuclease HII